MYTIQQIFKFVLPKRGVKRYSWPPLFPKGGVVDHSTSGYHIIDYSKLCAVITVDRKVELRIHYIYITLVCLYLRRNGWTKETLLFCLASHQQKGKILYLNKLNCTTKILKIRKTFKIKTKYTLSLYFCKYRRNFSLFV